MKNYYLTKTKTIASMYDGNLKLRFDEILTLMQDLATAHSYDLQTDHDTLMKKSNAFWVLTRAKFKINFNVKNNSFVYCKTWPIKPSGVRFLREYTFSQNSQTVIDARTEWCVLGADNFSVKRPDAIAYPNELKHLTKKSLTPDFIKTKFETTSNDFCYNYKVLLTDIDCNKHTNNVSYAKMALNAFSFEDFSSKNFTTFEIKFINQTFFGDIISIYKKQTENGFYIEGKIQDKQVFYTILS